MTDDEQDYEPASIKQTAWVFRALFQHLIEGGTFRQLIYNRMGYGTDAYVHLFCAGGQSLSNALSEAREGPWEELLSDFPRVFDFLIEIAAGFDYPHAPASWRARCNLCQRYMEDGCEDQCAALRARRLLGVA